MALNPYQRYQQQSVMTMTQGEMLTKLYDEIVKQLSAAQISLQEKDYGAVNRQLQKAQRVLNHLRVTLDPQYEISQNLSALYDYFIRRLIEANLRKDGAPVQEVLGMVEELRETFIQADRAARRG